MLCRQVSLLELNTTSTRKMEGEAKPRQIDEMQAAATVSDPNNRSPRSRKIRTLAPLLSERLNMQPRPFRCALSPSPWMPASRPTGASAGKGACSWVREPRQLHLAFSCVGHVKLAEASCRVGRTVTAKSNQVGDLQAVDNPGERADGRSPGDPLYPALAAGSFSETHPVHRELLVQCSPGTFVSVVLGVECQDMAEPVKSIAKTK